MLDTTKEINEIKAMIRKSAAYLGMTDDQVIKMLGEVMLEITNKGLAQMCLDAMTEAGKLNKIGEGDNARYALPSI
jgi:hypothetical protein